MEFFSGVDYQTIHLIRLHQSDFVMQFKSVLTKFMHTCFHSTMFMRSTSLLLRMKFASFTHLTDG